MSKFLVEEVVNYVAGNQEPELAQIVKVHKNHPYSFYTIKFLKSKLISHAIDSHLEKVE